MYSSAGKERQKKKTHCSLAFCHQTRMLQLNRGTVSLGVMELQTAHPSYACRQWPFLVLTFLVIS